jgi:hypothetical protein
MLVFPTGRLQHYLMGVNKNILPYGQEVNFSQINQACRIEIQAQTALQFLHCKQLYLFLSFVFLWFIKSKKENFLQSRATRKEGDNWYTPVFPLSNILFKLVNIPSSVLCFSLNCSMEFSSVTEKNCAVVCSWFHFHERNQVFSSSYYDNGYPSASIIIIIFKYNTNNHSLILILPIE